MKPTCVKEIKEVTYTEQCEVYTLTITKKQALALKFELGMVRPSDVHRAVPDVDRAKEINEATFAVYDALCEALTYG